MSLPASPPPAAAVEQPTTAAPTSPQPPAQPESSTTTSWSQEMKNRLERMAKASSNNIELYPGTPAYVAARKLEETIEKTWREYLVELVRNDLAAGITSGRRKHHWQKNECLVVYELVPGAQLEEFPSSDAAKREEYLARTVRDALYIKVPQFSSGFGSPPKSPSAVSSRFICYPLRPIFFLFYSTPAHCQSYRLRRPKYPCRLRAARLLRRPRRLLPLRW
ncbi:hypothetical protein DL93DRAFT_340862 [Clavulina sp. PMI_390]|nr:hypothetical protein DL93DRAFT_340862 [Clavulina sp. PMI_390]